MRTFWFDRLVASREALNAALAVAMLAAIVFGASTTAFAQDDASAVESYDRDMLTSLIETVIAADEGELIMTGAIPDEAREAPVRQVAAASASSTGPLDITPRPRPVSDAERSVSALPDAPRADGFALQLGSFSSPENAQAGFEAADAQYASAMPTHTLYVQPVDLGDRGVFHRLRLGGFADITQATEACRTLGIGAADCMIVSASQR